MADHAPLVLSGLAHSFGSTPVLDGVSLQVGAGEFVALLGASGCGKTTVLRAVAGLVTPSAGSIVIDGNTVVSRGVEQVPCEQRGVGLVFQEYALFPHMTVAENVAYGLETRDAARVNGLLEVVGMSALAQRMPAQLSGGQQQRVALARALAPRPALLLLDEPFANVDAALRDSLGRMLRRVVRDEGASVLMVTHDQQTALGLADRVVVLESHGDGSQITQDGSPATVYRQPASAGVAQMTGPCMMIEGAGHGDTATTALGEVPLTQSMTGPIKLALRPEQLRFVSDPEGCFMVSDVQFSGAHHQLRCTGNAGDWLVLGLGETDVPAVGTAGRIHVVSPVWSFPCSKQD
jgi:iron(III) transport system ATP-binding protein